MISVIIPAYNAEKTISNCLHALEEQSVKEKFEVIIVDDGSTDRTAETAKGFKGVRVILQANKGPAGARNHGAREACGEILVFTDADCEPAPNWLMEMARPLEDSLVGGVQGAYATRQKEAVARLVQLEIEERYERMKKSKELDWIGTYAAAFRRKDFMELKGFDEAYKTSSGEDPDFSYRLHGAGKRLAFNPNAVVYHTHPCTWSRYFWTKFYRAAWRTKLYKDHPGKAVHDSYTPQLLKAQIILTYIALAGVFLGSGFLVIGASAVLLGSGFPFAFFVKEKEKGFWLEALALVVTRSFAFALGLPYGVLKGMVAR